MKPMMAFLLGSAALVANTGLASAARQHHPTPASAGSPAYVHQIVRPSKLETLYDQNADDNGFALVSQNFESNFAAYDSQAADDFTVPAGVTWRVSEIDVTGQYFTASGPAASENVFFYKDRKGLPGKLIHTFTGLAGSDDFGSFVIKLPNVKLKPGHYWVSVQVNMDFSSGGEWGWEESSVVHDDPSAWQNPGGGFGVCPTWNYAYICVPNTRGRVGSTGYDQMFALKGKTKAG